MPFKMPYGTSETYAEARRVKLILGLNDGAGPEGVATIQALLIKLLTDGENDGFHGVEIDMLMFKKDN